MGSRSGAGSPGILAQDPGRDLDALTSALGHAVSDVARVGGRVRRELEAQLATIAEAPGEVAVNRSVLRYLNEGANLARRIELSGHSNTQMLGAAAELLDHLRQPLRHEVAKALGALRRQAGGRLAAPGASQAFQAYDLMTRAIGSWERGHVKQLGKSAAQIAAAVEEMWKFGREHALAHALKPQDPSPVTDRDLGYLREVLRLASHMAQLTATPALFYEQAALLARHLNTRDWDWAVSHVLDAINRSRGGG